MKLSDLPKPMMNGYTAFYKDKGSVDDYISYLQGANVGLIEEIAVTRVNKLLGDSIIKELEITGTPSNPRILVRVGREHEGNCYYIGAPSEIAPPSAGKSLIYCDLRNVIKLAMSFWYTFDEGCFLLFQRGYYGFADYDSPISRDLEHANYFYFSPTIGAQRAPYGFICKDNFVDAKNDYLAKLFSGHRLLYDQQIDYKEWIDKFKDFNLKTYILDSTEGERFKNHLNFFDFVDIEFVN